MLKRIKHKIGLEKKKFKGYPHYPGQEDIYSRMKKEEDLDPENPTKVKAENEILSELNEKDFEDDVSAGDLDVPGSELDDEMENIGSEDEENNYYSLGGDNHFEDGEKDKDD